MHAQLCIHTHTHTSAFPCVFHLVVWAEAFVSCCWVSCLSTAALTPNQQIGINKAARLLVPGKRWPLCNQPQTSRGENNVLVWRHFRLNRSDSCGQMPLVIYDRRERSPCFYFASRLAASSLGRCAPKLARLCSLAPVSCTNRDKDTVFDRSAPGETWSGRWRGPSSAWTSFFFRVRRTQKTSSE